MRLRFVIIGSFAVVTMVLAVLGPQATAAQDASACNLLRSALKKELPVLASRFRLEAPVQNYEMKCIFTDNGRLVGWKWFAQFDGMPNPSGAAAAKRLWQRGYAEQKRLSNQEGSGTDVIGLRGHGADNAYAVVVTDAKRPHNKVDAIWQKGVWLGVLSLQAPRTTLFATDTDELKELLPVLMRGVPRTYP